MSYNVGPFLPRLLDVPTQVIVAEKDDLTLWDLEIEAYNQIPTAEEATRRDRRLDAHDALQRPVAARRRRRSRRATGSPMHLLGAPAA